MFELSLSLLICVISSMFFSLNVRDGNQICSIINILCVVFFSAVLIINF